MPSPDLPDEPLAVTPAAPTERAEAWAATMGGHRQGDAAGRRAHAGSTLRVSADSGGRQRREEVESLLLADGATHAVGAGQRATEEPPDPERTCFERDRDRILHSSAFRRLAGKTQVFVFPDDHQRTRLTHALEVAQVATAVSRAIGLNVALTEAIALGHDCGHGPGGHASEDAFTPFVEGGYDHAVWGADNVLAPLNLCEETVDGIRNHSWSRPAPRTPEGEVVSWADRIAYVCHDFEDAVAAGIVSPEQLPAVVRERCGDRRSRQLNAFTTSVIETVRNTGIVAMAEPMAEALAEFRRFNYERIYMRPASLAQNEAVITVLQALVEHFAEIDHDAATPAEAARRAVTYVGGMTDQYAFSTAVKELGWQVERLPVGIA